MTGAAAASVRRDGDALAFAGDIVAAQVPALWSQAQAARAGAARLELSDVTALDSAGLALLAELAGDGALAVAGTPPGLDELCRAYRLTATLAFVSA